MRLVLFLSALAFVFVLSCTKAEPETPKPVETLEPADTGKQQPAPQQPPEPGEDGEIARLVGDLGSGDWKVRNDAAEALKKIGEPAVESLLSALKDRSREVRKNAAWVLGEIADPDAVEPLIEALRDDNKDVRSYAVSALGKIGGDRVIPPLRSAANDTDKDVRTLAEKALAELEPQAPPPSPEPVTPDRPKPPSEKPTPVAGKQQKDTKTVSGLVMRLRDSDPRVRYDAALQLAMMGDKTAVPPLIKALGDKNPSVRQVCARALGDIGDNTAVPALTTALRSDPDQRVRDAAKVALQKIGEK